jgi:pimeloyl-ACP methyl ester carboxylesterase
VRFLRARVDGEVGVFGFSQGAWAASLAAVEEVLRGAGDRRLAERLLAAAVERPWFELSYLPRTLPAPGDSWPDMDHDPEPAFSRVRCPVLLIYGDDEECVPAQTSKTVWQRAAVPSTRARLTVVDLPGCGHFPAPGHSGASTTVPVSAFSATYTTALERWAGDVVRSS